MREATDNVTMPNQVYSTSIVNCHLDLGIFNLFQCYKSVKLYKVKLFDQKGSNLWVRENYHFPGMQLYLDLKKRTNKITVIKYIDKLTGKCISFYKIDKMIMIRKILQ